MVRKGSFDVQLIHVDSRNAFQERKAIKGKNPGMLIEVEPDAQYWIRLESFLPPDKVCRCEIEVDECSLGYHVYLQGNERQDVGLWSRATITEHHRRLQQQETHEALQFQQVSGDHESEEAFERLGHIRVTFYEAIAIGKNKIYKKFNNPWKSKRTLQDKSKLCWKKIISKVGSTKQEYPLSSRNETKGPAYKKGNSLECIDLYYGPAPAIRNLSIQC